MDALQAKRWKKVLKQKVLFIKSRPPSKHLSFNLNDPKVVCYEREGLMINEFVFEIVRFLKSREDKIYEVKKITNDPRKPKMRDFGATRDRLIEKAEFIHQRRVS